MKILFLILATALAATGAELASGEYFITQSWSQETDFRRPYHVSVPQNADKPKLPVLIFLHGNGGKAERAMHGFLRKHSTIASGYITVFPSGYQKSWNIVSERSRADDRGFIEAVITELATNSNVDATDFSVMGASNGAALVNQMAIETKLPSIRNYVAVVSPLNVWQHDGTHFKAKGDDNNYKTPVVPMTGKRLLNVSGTEDRLVPYRGGPSRGIPAKGGKLAFVDAEESIFLWAKAMGYDGDKLAQPTRVDGRLEIFSYLDGAVVHYKAVGQGHGSGGAISESVLFGFLVGRSK